MAFKTIKRNLYKDTIELLFNPNARNRYLVNDKEKNATTYPIGVTTVLGKTLAKEALMLWPLNMAINYLKPLVGETLQEQTLELARKQYVMKSDKGKDVGSEVHEAIEQFLKDGTLDFVVTSSDAEKALKAFVAWCDKVKPKVLATEQIVYSKQHTYAGTFDVLLEIDGKVVLADIKTTNASQDAPLGVYPEYFLQLAAYSWAFAEGGGSQQIDDLMVINASKTGKLSTLRASDLNLTVMDCEAAWLDVLFTYKFIQPLSQLIKEGKG